ncbi:hypothetical protein Ddc_20223 [Ditylenchus destructor]|nr:hypothetical protein Ddc_20223 [Ditylenchus destructor]
MSRHAATLYLVLFLTLSVLNFGNGTPDGFSLHMGVINGRMTDPIMKYRWFDSGTFEQGSSSYTDYTNAMNGNFTAMKTLVRSQLGVTVTNLFYRKPKKAGDKLIEFTNDRELNGALYEYTDLDVYACRVSNVQCFTMVP